MLHHWEIGFSMFRCDNDGHPTLDIGEAKYAMLRMKDIRELIYLIWSIKRRILRLEDLCFSMLGLERFVPLMRDQKVAWNPMLEDGEILASH